MDFKEIEDKINEVNINYGKKYNIEIDQEYAVHKLHEEVGEFAQAWLIYKKRCRPEKIVSNEKAKENLAEELADIVGIASLNAKLLGINLEKAINKKWFKYLKRI